MLNLFFCVACTVSRRLAFWYSVALMEPVVRVPLIVGAELAFIEVAIADEEIVLAILTPRGRRRTTGGRAQSGRRTTR